MTRILSILAVLSILIYPNISKADGCKHKSVIQSALIHIGFMPVFQMTVGDKVAHIYIRDDGAFMFFKIEEDDTVCQIFGGKHFSHFPRRVL